MPARSKQHLADFRFYGPLNDFLRPDNRQKTIPYGFNGRPAIKDAVEANGVPHSEVDLLVVGGQTVNFGYHLRPGDRVAVYPRFKAMVLDTGQGLFPPLPTPARFVLDVHLGKLARFLRLMGIDTDYRNDLKDPEIVDIGVQQARVILTRDLRLLFAKRIVHGYWVRAQLPEQQLSEILRRFDLYDQIQPLTRCTHCNGLIQPVTKARVRHLLEPKTNLYYEVFRQCGDCGQVYWKGSHYQKLMRWIDAMGSLNNDLV